MKGVLEFNLPEDNTDFRNAVDASKAFSCLCDIMEQIRKLRKYGASTEKLTLDTIADMVRENFPDLDER